MNTNIKVNINTQWVGLTGGIASGKSTVSKMLQDLGIPIIDADLLAKEAMSPKGGAYTKVIDAFGSDILNSQGEIDRAQLGDKVFSNPSQLKILESIVHPIVRTQTQKKYDDFSAKEARLVIHDVPLLFEKNLQEQYNHILVVYCHLKQQVQRLRQRNSYTENQAQIRIQSQTPLEEKKKLASFIIDNTYDINKLKLSVKNAVQYLKFQDSKPQNSETQNSKTQNSKSHGETF